MFLPQRMTRLVLAGHKDHMPAVIEALHEEGVLHLEDYQDPTRTTTIGTPLEEGELASELLVRVRGIQKALGAEDATPREMVTESPERVVADAEAAILPPLDEAGDLRARLAQVESEIAVLQPFSSLDVELTAVQGLEHVKVRIGTVREDPRPALRNASFSHEVDLARAGKAWSVALAFRTEEAAEADRLLASLGFSPAAIPAQREGTPAQRLQTLQEQRVRLLSQLAVVDARIAALRHEWGVRLASLERHLSEEVQKTQAPLRFAVTASTFHAEGWVPLRAARRVEEALRAEFHDALVIETLVDGTGHGHGAAAAAGHRAAPAAGHVAAPAAGGAAAHAAGKEQAHVSGTGKEQAHVSGPDDLHGGHSPRDEPPTALENKGLAKPFEFLLGLLGRPRYQEIDPTKLMLIFFPLFFGFMVGDLLIGVVIMLFGLYLKTHFIFGIGGNAVGRLLIMGGLMSAIFGLVLFGEAMGIHFVVDAHGLEEGERSWEEIIYGKEAVLAGHGFPTDGFLHKTGADAHGGDLALHQTDPVSGDNSVPPPPEGADAHDGAAGADDHAGDEEAAGGITGFFKPHSDTHLSVGGYFNLGFYSKVHDVFALLAISIIVGLVHIVLGLVLGVRNVYVAHGAKLAIQEKVSWLLILASIGVIAWAYMGGLTMVLYGAAAVFVVAVALLWMGVQHTIGVGFISILEIPSLFGNLLSYTRLAAIGASKAGMAIAFSTIGFGMVGGAGGWAIYILGALLITVLAILAGSLQSLRLQFVEFFSKFYEGGGRPYVPFGRRAA